jgi:hypothetical protein
VEGPLQFLTDLTSMENERVTSRLQAGFNNQGDLILEGYDIGPAVQQHWDHEDYEYATVVRQAELPRLIEELARAGQARSKESPVQPFLMDVLKKLFSPGQADLHFKSDGEFRTWLHERKIPSDFSSWP